MDVPEIEFSQARLLHEEGSATFVDIRDPIAFEEAHIPGAVRVDQSNVQEFVAEADKEAAVVVYCYKGNASRDATAFFPSHGFTSVSSLSGGFTAWHEHGGASEPSG